MILGIIGGLIGGLIATIPWILASVYLEIMASVLAIPVALGVKFGYKLFGGKADKKLPIIIGVLSVLSIVIATMLFIPMLILSNEGVPVSLEIIMYIYGLEGVLVEMLKELAFGVVFTALGIRAVLSATKNEVNASNNDEKVIVNENEYIETTNTDMIESEISDTTDEA